MPGRIRREDVAAVRERARIEEIVGEHVTLRPAGVGSMKGLCPFHDERTPSFHVRPQVGLWHCFGCGEGGDVISFLQKIDGLGFTEAVEHLAGRVGVQLRYEEGGAPRPGEEPGRRQRLLEAHRAAATYYAEQLITPDAAPARGFLAERGFDREAAEHFGVGFAPRGWDHLLRHLRGRGFTEGELTASGLMSQGNRGPYDRFRGRLVWPIRDVTGDTVGFGARKIFDDDQGPKYLNSPETPLYRKTQVLYGIDLAKREIAKAKQVVVVEGYTDVMAAHLSGVRTAVATCGTAFGSDHARIVRRLLGDTSAGAGVQLSSGLSLGGEVIFTFDGDEAGQKAALRAFGEDQRFYAQTFVAISPGGMDPCELRQSRGPDAVVALVSGRQPLFEFVVRSTLSRHDLDTAEGRVAALRAAAPVVAGIRDTALRPEYSRLLAGWLGMEGSAVERAVAAAGRQGGRRDDDRVPGPEPRAESGRPAGPDRRDPVATLERQVLEAVLQYPSAPGAAAFDQLEADAFTVPALRAVHEAIRAAGGVAAASDPVAWLDAVREEAASTVAPLVAELAVTPLPEDRADAIGGYVGGVVRRLVELGLTRRIADARGRLQRMAPDDEGYAEAFARLIALEGLRRALRSEE
ncbi:DNA primase [Isoptericola sp. b441]|uniref:DNA primase n=1 Tax=Actinotalea lenta TaxID=3064654 RepID=A0ABT9DEN9_9CELL|nr:MULTISPECIES: DNA primase [unclassified Isoptericola]MDO8108086.1 DNA primase [Isoptericola sp. b441]MDO8120245.1 DNA primase [Isoptericola sp. b490]